MIFELVAALFSADDFDDLSKRQQTIAWLLIGAGCLLPIVGAFVWLALAS